MTHRCRITRSSNAIYRAKCQCKWVSPRFYTLRDAEAAGIRHCEGAR